MTTLDYQIAADADDGWDDGAWHASSAHWWGVTGGTAEDGGYRFTGVAVPQGATITAAYLSFWARNTPPAGMHMRLYANAADNPAAFSGSDLPRNAAQTTAFVAVEPSSEGWASGQFNNTVDCTAVIQEIVDRAGWASGNAMRFMVVNNSSTAELNLVSDYNNSTAEAAKLHIEYSSAVTLTVVALTVATTIDAPALTQHNVLVVADLAIATTADNVALTQHNVLVVADLAVAVAVDAVVLTQHNALVVVDLTVATTVDGVTLELPGVLVVQAATVAVTIDNPALTQHNALAVDDLAVAVMLDSPALGVALTVDDLAVAVALDSLELPGQLTVQDTAVAVALESPALVQHHVLTVADMSITVSMDTVIMGLIVSLVYSTLRGAGGAGAVGGVSASGTIVGVRSTGEV